MTKKCIGLSACGGPCDESCPVNRKPVADEELNARLADVNLDAVTDLTEKVARFYEGEDLATALLSLHMLIRNYLEAAPPVMVKESHHIYAQTAMHFAALKGKKRPSQRH